MFPGTNFPGTNFPGTIFPGTIFLGTIFPGTHFPGTIFPRTLFPGDHFSGDQFSWALFFRGPFFLGTIFPRTVLICEWNSRDSRIDASTRIKKSLKAISHYWFYETVTCCYKRETVTIAFISSKHLCANVTVSCTEKKSLLNQQNWSVTSCHRHMLPTKHNT